MSRRWMFATAGFARDYYVLRFIGIVGFLLSLLCSSAQASSLALPDYLLQRWTASDGLPHNSINAIVQTDDGYLWLATWNGLVRYNGDRFQRFGRSELTGLPSSAIRAVVKDPAGGMLVMSTRGGLSRYNEGRWEAQLQAPGVVKHQIRSRDGNLWLAVEGKGVFRRVPGQRDQVLIPNIVANRLLQDESGTIWVAADQGLYRIDAAGAEKVGKQLGLPDVMVYEVIQTSSGQLLLGTDRGVWQMQSGRFVALESSLSHVAVSSLFEDSKRDLWIGTISHGLYRIGTRGMEHLGTDQGLPQNRIMSIIEDTEGSTWVGTNGGLIQLREAPFITWTERRGLKGDYVRTVLGHSDGSVWVGGSSGLSRIVPGYKRALTPAAQSLSVLSLAEGADGDVWVGTYDMGLLRWHNGNLEPVLNQHNGLGSNEVRAIVHDRQGRLWAGTPKGVVQLQQDGSVRRFGKAEGLADTFVIAMVEAPDGSIWVGTSTGIARLGDDGSFHKVPLPVLASDDYVYGLALQGEFIWLATERGQVRVNLASGKQQLISTADGLPVESCFQIVPDAFRQLWLSCRTGVMQLRLDDIEARLGGQVDTIPYRLYGVGDGLLTGQANGVSNPAATLDDRGQIWIATAKGVSMVDPGRLMRTVVPSIPVVLESVQVDQDAVETAGEVMLPAGTGRLQVSYAGLSYMNSEQIRYRTLLQGFDGQWTERGGQTRVEYTSLPPGNYQLRVQARYPQGNWEDNEVRLAIIQQPFLWQRGGFLAGIGIAAIVGLIVLYHLRTRQLRRSEARLQAQVKVQTKALREQAEAFERQARQDPLTGLANRRSFDEEFTRRFARSRQQQTLMALAVIDIDHFKRINDQWSHMVGDEAIKAVAELLRQRAPEGSFIARWGGEEFTLLLEDADCMRARADCEDLRRTLENAVGLVTADIRLTASFGIADNRSAGSYAQMLLQADMALCKAKENGRNRTEIWQPDADDELMMADASTIGM